MTSRSVVVKIGTTSVTDDSGNVAHEVLAALAGDVVALRNEGWSLVVVTSGAITAGWAEVGQGLSLIHISSSSRPNESVVILHPPRSRVTRPTRFHPAAWPVTP